MKVVRQLYDWAPYIEKGQPVWFWVIMNVQSDLDVLGAGDAIKKEVIQKLKKESLASLNVRGNMLNLREKHIPRLKQIYKSVLENFIVQA